MLKSRIFTAASACALLPLSLSALAVDTGDAPLSYGTASHTVVEGAPYFGEISPDDNEPVAGPLADLDDTDNGAANAIDDEDGVFGFPTLVQNGKAWDVNVFATNPGTSDVTIVGWVDFDGNGNFEPDEAASGVLPAGADNEKVKLIWNDLRGITTDYFGTTYLRIRVSSDSFGNADPSGQLSDGEVEDYLMQILSDTDGDEIPNQIDPDNDNDGIPDVVEGTSVDTDNDGTPDYLDFDSDNDFVPDFVEAGDDPQNPVDTDGDGFPDYVDLDSNDDGVADGEAVAGDDDADGATSDVEGNFDSDGDGILNGNDVDSDNDLIPDAIEIGNGDAPVDTDGDGVPDFLDLDSDNDGISDLREGNVGALDVGDLDLDNNGRVDSGQVFGANGMADAAETQPDSGIPVFAISDADLDGVRDYVDLDSDNDGISDILEAGGSDSDSNGTVDSNADVNGDGYIDDAVNALTTTGALPDVDEDFLPDFQDADADGSAGGGSTSGGSTDGSTDGSSDGGTDTGSTDGSTDGGVTGGDSAEIIQTGVNGCTIGAVGEPVLPLMALLAVAGLLLRRRAVTIA